MFVFEWDENKEKSNWRKHKIRFAEAEPDLQDKFPTSEAVNRALRELIAIKG